MFQVNDRVVHPCYGAGVISRIQIKSISDETRSYYVINTASKSLQVMVPVERAESVGLRPVSGEGRLREALEASIICPAEEDIDKDLHNRQNTMRERLKSGAYSEVVDVVRMLYFMNSRRPLGTIDRQLFDQGKDLLSGELALATGFDPKEALQEIELQLGKMLECEEEQV